MRFLPGLIRVRLSLRAAAQPRPDGPVVGRFGQEGSPRAFGEPGEQEECQCRLNDVGRGRGYGNAQQPPSRQKNDDQGHVAGKSEEIQYRARQNVILELGMVLARLGRPRVAILHKESVELPSDIAGLIYIPFKERVDEVKAKLFGELQAAGYTPNSDALSG